MVHTKYWIFLCLASNTNSPKLLRNAIDTEVKDVFLTHSLSKHYNHNICRITHMVSHYLVNGSMQRDVPHNLVLVSVLQCLNFFHQILEFHFDTH